MNIIRCITDFLSSTITIIIGLKCVGYLFSRKMKINIIMIIAIILSSLSIVFYSYYGDSLIRPITSLLVLFVCSVLCYKENTNKTLVYSSICIILIGFYEILLSLFLINLHIIDLNNFDDMYIIKGIFSIVTMLFTYFTIKIKKINKIIQKMVSNEKIIKFIAMILIIIILLIMVLDFKYTSSYTYRNYIASIIFILCIVIVLYSIVKDHIEIQNEINKSNALLGFMEKYEKIIDSNRENNHELLNNLLVLKSIKNKNSKEFNNLFDELVNNSANKGMKAKNIYNLPSGIKGIFYYKLYGLEEKNYNISINVSKRSKTLFKKIDYNNNIVLSKIVAIVLDNAIEASSKTSNKCLIIDVYEIDNNIVIEIANSYKGKIDINNIRERKYTTKGKNRGYGLYIMNNLLKNSSDIKVEQSTKDNYFYTKIMLKKK